MAVRKKRRRLKKPSPRKKCGSRKFDHQLIELKKSLDELSLMMRRKK